MAEGASSAGRHTGFDLLPPSATAVERALSLVSAEARDAIHGTILLPASTPRAARNGCCPG